MVVSAEMKERFRCVQFERKSWFRSPVWSQIWFGWFPVNLSIKMILPTSYDEAPIFLDCSSKRTFPDFCGVPKCCLPDQWDIIPTHLRVSRVFSLLFTRVFQRIPLGNRRSLASLPRALVNRQYWISLSSSQKSIVVALTNVKSGFCVNASPSSHYPVGITGMRNQSSREQAHVTPCSACASIF